MDAQRICTRCNKPHTRESTICWACAYPNKEKIAAQKKAKEDKERADKAEQRAVDQAALVTGRKAMFLAELEMNGGHVEKACRAAGVSRVMMGRYRDADPEFAAAWETTQDYNVEKLEAEVDRRALGYEEPIVYQGKIQGRWVGPNGESSAPGEWGAVFVPDTITKFSDNLLMFRLKALRPEKYRDGPGVKPGSGLSEAELDEALTKMMAKRSGRTKPTIQEADTDLSM